MGSDLRLQISEKESVLRGKRSANFNYHTFLIFETVNWTQLIQDPEVQKLLKVHAKADVAQLALKWSSKKDFPGKFLLSQLQCRQKAQSKLPTWAENDLVIYPDSTALEQCSSEKAADYKAEWGRGQRMADLTGGLGVDSNAFSKAATSMVYVEPDPSRFELAVHNLNTLGSANITFLNKTAEEAISEFAENTIDLIYIDPSRRDAQQKRFFKLADLQPDVLRMMPRLQKLAKKILIKAAPMLDIKQALLDFGGAEKIQVVSLHNECRELLFLLGENNSTDPEIECIELDDLNSIFRFRFGEEEQLEIKTGEISKYLYDPFAAVTKAGAFKSIAKKLDLHALHANTHVYSSEQLVEHFPGRVFEVKSVVAYDPKKLLALFPDKKATLVLRNFPVESATVLKQLPLKSDIKNYLFLVTDCNGNAVAIVCEKLFSL